MKPTRTILRKGARTPDAVPQDVLRALEAGAESANHMEQIALDMGTLLGRQFPQLAARAGELRKMGLVGRMRRGGELLVSEVGMEAVASAQAASSDTVRGWGAMAVGAAPGLQLEERLALVQPFAADSHFAVREWAWLSLRPHVGEHLLRALDLLALWGTRDDPFERRFAIEVTRPRGVWSEHIPLLKKRPDLGEELLEAVRSDPARYVQDSVANWINDASKTSPDWACHLCARWREVSSPATERICRRAMRTLSRSNHRQPATTTRLHSLPAEQLGLKTA